MDEKLDDGDIGCEHVAGIVWLLLGVGDEKCEQKRRERGRKRPCYYRRLPHRNEKIIGIELLLVLVQFGLLVVHLINTETR